MAIGLVHLERPWAQAATLLMFSIAMVTTLGVIALHERPFDGPLAIGPESIRAARLAMAAGSPPSPRGLDGADAGPP